MYIRTYTQIYIYIGNTHTHTYTHTRTCPATHTHIHTHTHTHTHTHNIEMTVAWYLPHDERWEAGVETQKNVRGEIGGWSRVPFNETYALSLSTIYDGA